MGRELFLWQMNAERLSGLFDRRQVSPVEVLEAILDRMEATNKRLNAFCHVAVESAREAARLSEQRMFANARFGNIDGVPLSIKDNLFVRGMPCTWGSRLYREFQPDVDDVPVARLRAAGAVLIGKTNTPEFSLSARTENDLFGATLNPWDVARVPGGSSGGAAAAVAAGLAPFGLATDAGGSIRRPASYCGVVGLRTTPGAVQRHHGFPALVYDFQTVGPLARTVRDAGALYHAVASCGRSRPPCGGPDPLGELRVGLITSGSGFLVDEEVAERVRSAAHGLERLGYKVEEIEAPYDAAEIDEIWAVLSSVGMARLARIHDRERWAAEVSNACRAIAKAGEAISGAEYVLVLDRLQVVRKLAAAWFKKFDLYLSPSSPCTAWPIHDAYPAVIGGKVAEPGSAAVFAKVANAAALPAISVPVGLSSDGLPIGAQIIGPPNSEEVLLWVAEELEGWVGNDASGGVTFQMYDML